MEISNNLFCLFFSAAQLIFKTSFWEEISTQIMWYLNLQHMTLKDKHQIWWKQLDIQHYKQQARWKLPRNLEFIPRLKCPNKQCHEWKWFFVGSTVTSDPAKLQIFRTHSQGRKIWSEAGSEVTGDTIVKSFGLTITFCYNFENVSKRFKGKTAWF